MGWKRGKEKEGVGQSTKKVKGKRRTKGDAAGVRGKKRRRVATRRERRETRNVKKATRRGEKVKEACGKVVKLGRGEAGNGEGRKEYEWKVESNGENEERREGGEKIVRRQLIAEEKCEERREEGGRRDTRHESRKLRVMKSGVSDEDGRQGEENIKGAKEIERREISEKAGGERKRRVRAEKRVVRRCEVKRVKQEKWTVTGASLLPVRARGKCPEGGEKGTGGPYTEIEEEIRASVEIEEKRIYERAGMWRRRRREVEVEEEEEDEVEEGKCGRRKRSESRVKRKRGKGRKEDDQDAVPLRGRGGQSSKGSCERTEKREANRERRNRKSSAGRGKRARRKRLWTSKKEGESSGKKVRRVRGREENVRDDKVRARKVAWKEDGTGSSGVEGRGGEEPA
ncbi:hypothetical protein Tco_1058067 [Tanacetum coccineum]|uniref:Uncharacterized protein n=1 Tax=Tanacetum coccineum TaxID=301880 RepID=A0ABQ5H7V6_9ASTR